MNKLPEVFKNEINKNINNNATVYYCNTDNNIVEEKTDINKFINDLFNEDGYIFNKPVIIKTKEKTYDTALVKKNNNSIYTLSDDLIYIDDIISINKKDSVN